ncbi:hypothetical protein HNQ07_004076 [Deinococcus metalli]|uniref:Uncharacterized protein n=1 Tax=Deinococcus metalli TaxID=1141878 RepID=A0A7W8KL55_9DEIO|nr:hypothetical protein [Deinococcus metalli]MBB5378569.1 hypothetical protein [Deinococcus metalli]GHF58689.1 hypothetical protein GCM10017781_38720 [Deinococcus metalli]
MDDWSVGGGEEAPDGRELFTAFYSTATVDLTARERTLHFTEARTVHPGPFHVLSTVRFTQLQELTSARQHLQEIRRHRTQLAVVRARQRLHLSARTRHYSFRREGWRVPGVVKLVIRLLRRYDALTHDDLEALQLRWGIQRDAAAGLDLRRYPLLFVEARAQTWRLTPWVERDVTFRVPSVEYAVAATQFWVMQRHHPTPQEEWNDWVRDRVALLLHQADVPPFLVESPWADVQRETALGRKWYRIDVERLPEGQYFTLVSAHGNLTYSVEGRAFLMEGVHQVSVVTPWATSRLKEALLMGETGIVWHAAGLAFRKALEDGQFLLCR